MNSLWPHSILIAYPYSTRNQHHADLLSEIDPGKWFTIRENIWEIKELGGVYQICASPWCMWNKDKILCEDIIKIVVDESDMHIVVKAARLTTYYRSVKFRYGSPSWYARART